jgi:hypothetical protein
MLFMESVRKYKSINIYNLCQSIMHQNINNFFVIFGSQKGLKHGCDQCLISTQINKI